MSFEQADGQHEKGRDFEVLKRRTFQLLVEMKERYQEEQHEPMPDSLELLLREI